MKQCITTYLMEASGHNTDIFYEILEHKYRKFIVLYWLLHDYSESIQEFTYLEQPIKEKLCVSIKIASKLRDQLIEDISELFTDEERQCEIEVNKKRTGLDIEITQDEIG